MVSVRERVELIRYAQLRLNISSFIMPFIDAEMPLCTCPDLSRVGRMVETAIFQ
jgi:hypothetical protein